MFKLMPSISQSYFLYIFLGIMALLFFFVLQPFIYTLILAAVFAVIFDPLHKIIFRLTGSRPKIAAFLSTILILLFILTPVIILGIQIFHEAQQTYFSLLKGGGGNLLGVLKGLVERIQENLPEFLKTSVDIEQYVKNGVSFILQSFTPFFSSILSIIINSIIFLLAFYYLLKDGPALKKKIVDLSPLAREVNDVILDKLAVSIDSVIKGNLVIAVVQGVVAGIGFALFGVPNPVLWGSVTSLASLIPTIGTGTVVIPSVLYLFLVGDFYPALGLMVWGLVAVGLIDNYLGPKLVGSKAKIHPFLVLLSVLGGVSFFGPVGFLLGPITLGLFLALFEIYSAMTP